MSVSYDEIKAQATKACEELVETAKLQKGDIFVIGCSSSEVVGLRIGKGSDINAAKAVYEGVMSVLQPRGIYLAAQCCEHLNRCVVIEKEALLPGTEIVNVVPQPHVVEKFVARGDQQVIAHRQFGIDLLLAHPHFDEDVLDDVLRHGRVLDDMPGEGVQQVVVAVEKHSKGCLVAAAHHHDKFRIP